MDTMIDRLEDLRHVLVDMMINLNAPKILFRPHRVELERAGLVQHAGGNLYERTIKGNEWVADYQQRQQMAKQVMDMLDVRDAALVAARARIAALEAELTERNLDLESARSIIKDAGKQVEELTAALEPFADDFENYTGGADFESMTLIEWCNNHWDDEAVLSSFERAYNALKGSQS